MAALACEGLPDRPCPRLRCDTSVHNTIYDLFLCNECERTRDEASKKSSERVTAAAAATEAAPAGQIKQKRQKADSVNVASKVRRKQPARQCDNRPITSEDPIDAVNQPASENELASHANRHSNAEFEGVSEVQQLKAEVNRLSGLVNSLSTKLNFVLSFLQLSDDMLSEPTTSGAATAATGAMPAATTTVHEGADSIPLFSAVVRSNRKPTNFREAAVSAVYIDQRQKDSRKNSVIISGLPIRSCTDKLSVSQLFKTEFDLDTDISVCKRLGQKISGKIQPLLVVLKNVEHVNWILSHAKSLRQSDDMFVRNQLYINPHLTKAEALAAYEQRCQRRIRNQRSVAKPAGAACSQRRGEIAADRTVRTDGPSSESPTDANDFYDVTSDIPVSEDVVQVQYDNTSPIAASLPASGARNDCTRNLVAGKLQSAP